MKLVFGKMAEEPEQAATAERAYTKADVMAALAKVEGFGDDVPEKIKDFEGFDFLHCGANLLAEALIDGLGEEEVQRKKLSDSAMISINQLVEKADRKAGKGR